MKIKDSQLQKIRRLYKKLVKEKSVDGDFEAKLSGTTGKSGTTPDKVHQKANPGVGTNYGDLHQAVTRRKFEFAARVVADTPDIRTDRVAEIQARIKAGTYKVDPESVAEAMIDAGLFDDI